MNRRPSNRIDDTVRAIGSCTFEQEGSEPREVGIRHDELNTQRFFARHDHGGHLQRFLNSNPETNFILRTGNRYDSIVEWLPGRSFEIGARLQF